MRVILFILWVMTLVFAGLLGYVFYQKFNRDLESKNVEIQQLQDRLTQIGELVPAFTVNADVSAGKKIEETDLTQIEVPISMSTNLVSDLNELVGKYYRMDISAGTALSRDMIWDIELTDDLRLFDLVLHTIPIGIKEGSYVDVRITLPMGEDFIAMSHKRVYGVNGGVLKVVVTEKDILTYNSMLIDSLIYPGTQLYAVEYVEAGIQKPADVYYPISKNVVAIAQRNPNLLEAIKSDILQRRGDLEESLSDITVLNNQRDSLDRILERGREQIRSMLKEGQRAYELNLERQKELEKEQAQ